MSKKLYVGNLLFSTTADDLREAFGRFGAVDSATVVSDRDTGRSRGFGFVEMAEGADQAIANLNGALFQGRTLTVNEARPRADRPRSEVGRKPALGRRR
jgi:RNA recognition motif-containing protein